MAGRSNALSELTRFWLEQRHGFFVQESVCVPVYRNQSDIDFVATKADGGSVHLPSGDQIGPRVIVEAKDEHDWEPTGCEFGQCFAADILKMGDKHCISARTRGVKFTMLREEHFCKAKEVFGSDDFDRLFVLHAIDTSAFAEFLHLLRDRRIYLLSAKELLADLEKWYRTHPRPSGLRNSLIGDLFHLLFGFCRVSAYEKK